MRYQIWLEEPTSAIRLRRVLWITGAAMFLWIVGAGGLQWTEQGALQRSQAALKSRTDALSQMEDALPQKRKIGLREASLRLAPPDAQECAAFSSELAQTAAKNHLSVAGLRFGSSDGAKAPVAAAGDEWTTQVFECRVNGRYGDIGRFLIALAASPRCIDFSAIQVAHADSDSEAANDPMLQMTLSGILSGAKGTQ